MPLTPQQQDAADRYIAVLAANSSFHEVDDAAASLGELGPGVVDYIAERMRAVYDGKSSAYVSALSLFRTDAAVDLLIEILETHSQFSMAWQAWFGLRERGKLPPRWHADDLTPALWHEQRAQSTQMPSPKTEQAALGDDGEYETDIDGPTDTIDADEKPKVKSRTRMTQANAGTYVVRTKWLPLLHSNTPADRAHALDHLTRMGKNAVPGLVASLTEENRTVWPYTILALKQIADPAALDRLRELANDDDPLIQTLAGGAVSSIERGHIPDQPKPTPAPSRPSRRQRKPRVHIDEYYRRMEEELDRWERDR